jgi:hypothetical protein
MNPMARWGDKGRYEGRDDDTTNAEGPKKFVIVVKPHQTSVTTKDKE